MPPLVCNQLVCYGKPPLWGLWAEEACAMKVFISHSRHDQAATRSLVNDLPRARPPRPPADAARRIRVPPPAAAAPEPPPADHELGPGQALPHPPSYRRPGILIAAAFAALIAEVGITVSSPGDPGTAPGGTIGTS